MKAKRIIYLAGDARVYRKSKITNYKINGF